MTLRSDHVAGGIMIAAGLVVWMLSGDLPFGRLSMPGAGMMPKLVCTLLIFFGLVLILRARESAPFASLDWSDLGHAAPVIGLAALAVALYTTLGFLVTFSLLLFGLLCLERQNTLIAAAYSVGATVLTYVLFAIVLKAPLERGLFGF